MAKSHLKLVTPATVNRTVTPKRVPNADLRTREYLTEAEVERLADCRQGQPLGPQGRHHDPSGLQARPAGLRTGGPALGSGGVRHCHPACPQGQAGHPKHPPDPRGRTAGAAAASARAGTQVALRVHLGTRGPVSARLASPAWSNGRAGRPSWPSRRTRTCSGTPAVTPWPTRATTHAPCKPTSATATFSIPSGTPSYHRRGLRIFGETSVRINGQSNADVGALSNVRFGSILLKKGSHSSANSDSVSI